VIRRGTGRPLVLLHGLSGSESMWRHVVPHLTPDFDTIAVTALGHRGGQRASRGATVADVVDDAERILDRLGLDRPLLAGNSLGGWVAIELARRGRAAKVCALSPAGSWDSSLGEHLPGAARLRATMRRARAARGVMPVLGRLRPIRHLALRDIAVHGGRTSRHDLIELTDDLLGCELVEGLLATTEQIAPLDPLPCPVTLAWSEHDRILPPWRNGVRARALLPGAAWREIPGVGHAPMLDDPRLVAQVIREELL
jgi:pimeloyl-ACP methyl ester carboxylesterase